ncbi:MAG: hypothetical protein JKY65_09270 [Planctomycetes bacterium]|nr:hypothetical protein [Planctomycetota bacterium]
MRVGFIIVVLLVVLVILLALVLKVRSARVKGGKMAGVLGGKVEDKARGSKMTTWALELERVAEGDVITCNTLTPTQLQEEFDSSQKSTHMGPPFTAWSNDWVYFPAMYDSESWAARVPRHPPPCGASKEALEKYKTTHVGGG